MKQKNDGFTLVEALLIFIILAMLSFMSWNVWNANQKNADTSNTGATNQKNESEKVETATYKDDVANYTLEYPSNWKVVTEKGEQGGPESPTVKTVLTSPKGTEIKALLDYGGRGGMCPPRETDKPHQKGNLCPTYEVLSATTIQQQVYGDFYNKGKLFPIDLLTSRYTNAEDGVSTYSIALSSDRADSTFSEVNEPVMGLFDVSSFITRYDEKGALRHYIYLSSNSNDSKFLESKEAEEVIKIFKTFKFES